MFYDFLKRVLDIIISLTALIIFAPIFLIVGLIVKLDSPGPVFADVPPRVGKDGKLFKMFKFRSMVAGAHDLLHKDPKFKKLLEEYQQNSYKINEDPRVTKVGKFLRKTSLDELPQFINVLRGEMSFVGHRAYYDFELAEQQEKFPQSKEFVKIILSHKPGITGLWQVSGRSNINFDKRVEMDARYVQRRSILFDLWIIARTIPAVLSTRGAV